ncbi:MAG: sigma-70 family RNA polymerase sigma factor [Planctomycetes bacterium]|nr:sigma-70 family RNA polymerase sigma factor [Planctomycetota bacterium]
MIESGRDEAGQELLRRMVEARERHRQAFLATEAAQATFLGELRRWRAGEISATRLVGGATAVGAERRLDREARLEELWRAYEEPRSNRSGATNDPGWARGLFAGARRRRRLAGLIRRLNPPTHLLQRLEDEALRQASRLTRARIQRRRRQFEELRNRLVAGRLDLVERMVTRYRNTPLPQADLIQEGRSGLLRATGAYDPELGVPFAAYARYWIRHGILDALARSSRLIRLPHWLNAALGRQARDQEEAAVPKPQRIEPRVQALEDETGRPRELTDPGSGDPVEDLARRELIELALRRLDDLPERDREILVRRFGLEDRRAEDRVQLARRFGLTPQRIGQLERRALDQVRRALRPARASA